MQKTVTAADWEVGTTLRGEPRTVTRTDFVRYAGVSGDFNPMHHDEVKAKAAGEPSVFGHGMLSAGLLASAITEAIGLAALRSYRVRFRRPVRPDETLTPVLVVTAVSGAAVSLDCRLENEHGQVAVSGSAEVEVRP